MQPPKPPVQPPIQPPQPPVQPPSPPVTPPKPSGQPPAPQPPVHPQGPAKCPLELDLQPGKFLPPVIEVNGEPSYNGEVGPGVSTTFTFNVPPNNPVVKKLSIVFALPYHGTMETSEWESQGKGVLAFSGGHSAPPRPFVPSEGLRMELESLPYQAVAGKQIHYTLESVGGAQLKFFQDFNPCPVGLFMVMDQ